jgi:hypothetical protein
VLAWANRPDLIGVQGLRSKIQCFHVLLAVKRFLLFTSPALRTCLPAVLFCQSHNNCLLRQTLVDKYMEFDTDGKMTAVCLGALDTDKGLFQIIILVFPKDEPVLIQGLFCSGSARYCRPLVT